MRERGTALCELTCARACATRLCPLSVAAADDGSFRVWDLRSFSSGEPVARFHWHKAAVTSVEWSPLESSTVAVSGADEIASRTFSCLP